MDYPKFIRDADAELAWIKRCNAIHSETYIERRLYDRVDADLMMMAQRCIETGENSEVGRTCCRLLALRLTPEEYQIFEKWAYNRNGE